MKRVDYPQPIRDLISRLNRLPGIGPRSAERIALWIQAEPSTFSDDLAGTLVQARKEISSCSRCGFFATRDGCAICEDDRPTNILCVVEQALDVLPIERTGVFEGRYHVLGGRLSPLNHVGPDDLRIGQLLNRVKVDQVEEVVLALSSDVEGEATSNYLADRLKDSSAKISCLAQGLPAGGGLETADELTLFRAFSGRRAWREEN
ncbi:MAG: recombination mediator RecR [Verrucomicrobiota bacterium]